MDGDGLRADDGSEVVACQRRPADVVSQPLPMIDWAVSTDPYRVTSGRW
jgi:hypothetical protein